MVLSEGPRTRRTRQIRVEYRGIRSLDLGFFFFFQKYARMCDELSQGWD
jgi:hypothetical protein